MFPYTSIQSGASCHYSLWLTWWDQIMLLSIKVMYYRFYSFGYFPKHNTGFQCQLIAKDRDIWLAYIFLVYSYLFNNSLLGEDKRAVDSWPSCTRRIPYWRIMTPYDLIELDPHYWGNDLLFVWRHQAITWTNVDYIPVGDFGIRLR